MILYSFSERSLVEELAVVALNQTLEEDVVEIAEVVGQKLLDTVDLVLVVLGIRCSFLLVRAHCLRCNVEHHPTVEQLGETLAAHVDQEVCVLDLLRLENLLGGTRNVGDEQAVHLVVTRQAHETVRASAVLFTRSTLGTFLVLGVAGHLMRLVEVEFFFVVRVRCVIRTKPA